MLNSTDLIDAVIKCLFPVSRFISPWSFEFAQLTGWAGCDPHWRQIRTGESPNRTNKTFIFRKTWRISICNTNMPSPLAIRAAPLALAASSSAFMRVHQRQLYCFCMVRLFRVFLRPVCTPGGIVKVCLGSCVFTHPRAPEVTPSRHRQRRPALACGDFQSGQAWRRATLPVLPFSSSGPALAALGGGRWSGIGWGETYWQAYAMFSEAQTSGSIAQYDGEKCLLLMKASSVSGIGRQPERHYVTEIL